MKKIIILFVFFSFFSCELPFSSSDERFLTEFEQTNGENGANYQQMTKFYKDLASRYGSIAFRTFQTNQNKSLHLVIYNSDGYFDFAQIRKNKPIILIINALEENQTEGVDATMLLMRNLAQEKILNKKDVAVVSIPMFNEWNILSDTLNIQDTARAIKDNFESDFIKNEYDNTQIFTEIFQEVKPNIFVDVRSKEISLDSTAVFYKTPNSLKNNKLQLYLQEKITSRVASFLKENSVEIASDSILKKMDFLPLEQSFLTENASSVDYASFFGAVSFEISSSKNQNYQTKVEQIYNTLKAFCEVLSLETKTILNLKQAQSEDFLLKKTYDFAFFDKELSVNVPKYYVIPKKFQQIIKKLQKNKIEMSSFEKDTILNGNVYYIEEFSTQKMPTDGHYKHYDTKISAKNKTILVRKGDFFLASNQETLPYIMEVLEPQAKESFFNWNYFDEILSQKDSLIYPIFRVEN